MSRAVANRGRPRSEAIDAAILSAAVGEIIDNGIAGLQMEAVAVRAGVAKTTVYRRWSDISELGLAAISSIESIPLDPPRLPPREQVLWLLRRLRTLWADATYAAVMRRIVADANAAPELYRDGRDRLIAPGVAALHEALTRCVSDRLIARDADLDLLRRTLVSPVISASLTLAPLPSVGELEALLDLVLRGAAPGRYPADS